MVKVVLIVLAIISFAAAKLPWQCDRAGRFSCVPQTQTCCESAISSTGYACFNQPYGVCCSDGKSICPTGTVCNVPMQRCDRPRLAFLEEAVEPIDAFETAGVPNAALDFARGFHEGFKLFKDLPHEDSCNPDDPQLVQDVLEIVELLKNISLTTDFKKLINDVIAKAGDFVSRVKDISAGCREFAQDIQKVLDSVTKHVGSTTYFQNLAFHTVANVGTITEKAKTSAGHVSSGNHFLGGSGFGDLVNFVLFWDFRRP